MWGQGWAWRAARAATHLSTDVLSSSSSPATPPPPPASTTLPSLSSLSLWSTLSTTRWLARLMTRA